ncbi:MAG: VacJ family lipoprotein [Myxococcota bacterium]
MNEPGGESHRPSRRAVGLLLAAQALLLSACAGPDPWEPMNRGTFWFNERFDRYLLEPSARGWDFVMPDVAQTGVSNFFANLRFPIIFVNDLLQFRPIAAGEDLARFLVNTTVGVVGFVDVASKLDIAENDEDFGQTLGFYRVPTGPYLVLPILGPSSPRGVLGLAGDWAAQPLNYVVPLGPNIGARVVDTVNLRAEYLEEIDQARADALDYYIFLRDAYLSNRLHRVRNRPGVATEIEEDLYYFDEEADEAEADGPGAAPGDAEGGELP